MDTTDEASWCDSTFGWGPFAPNTNTLTLCFCSTVLEIPLPIIFTVFGLPALVRISREPFVNPASSWTFSLKLTLSALAMFCAITLATFGEPVSESNTWAQVLLGAGWLLSVLLLVAGYLRAQPQLLLLRLWWVAQFVTGIIVFISHSTLHDNYGTHIVRLVSLACDALLVCLSFQSHDVPSYQAVETPLLSSAALSFRSPSGNLQFAGSSVASPLLVQQRQAKYATSGRFGLTSQLSQMTLYGADTSVFKGAISAWDEAISSSQKSEDKMLETNEENGHTDIHQNGNGYSDGKSGHDEQTHS